MAVLGSIWGGAGCLIIVAVILLFLGAIVVGWLFSIYNSLIMLKNNIRKSFADIDVLLKQRHDELPKLIDTVKGYMKYEKETLTKITELRASVYNAKTMADKAAASNALSGALANLFAVAENYPDLKASQNFIQLQTRISAIESQLADRREFYNDSVNHYNIRIASLPDMFLAKVMGYASEQLFQASEEEKKDVKVSFE